MTGPRVVLFSRADFLILQFSFLDDHLGRRGIASGLRLKLSQRLFFFQFLNRVKKSSKSHHRFFFFFSLETLIIV